MRKPETDQLEKRKMKLDKELVVALILALAVTIIFSGFNRPLWIDEYLHFALAGVPWLDAINLMIETSSNVNHGQTWFHQILSISTLHIFGAGAIGLRLVSWIATVVTILSAFFFLRLFIVPPIIKFLFLAILILIPTFSFEIGNSRFYMLLMMATTLTVFGLFTNIASKHSSWTEKTLFGFGVLIGALSHPYFPVVLLGLLVALYLTRRMVLGDNLWESIRATSYQLALTALSLGTSVGVGLFTWMRGGPEFTSMDPFDWLPINLPIFVAFSLLLFICGIATLIWLYRSSRNNPLDYPLAVGVVLLVTGVGMSVFFSWVSFVRSYWILPRQWLPGSIIALLGLTLVISYFWTKRKRQKPIDTALRVGVAVALVLFGFGILRGSIEIQTNAQYWNDLRTTELRNLTNDTNQFYTLAGNLNMKCGGDVWLEHSKFYDPKNNPKDSLEAFSKLFESCAIAEDKD
jgi:hypothetical protein